MQTDKQDKQWGGKRAGAGRPQRKGAPEQRAPIMLPAALVAQVRRAAKRNGMSIGKWTAHVLQKGLEMENERIRFFCCREVPNYTDVDAFVSDLALSSVWGDGPNDEIPQERVEWLRRLWKDERK